MYYVQFEHETLEKAIASYPSRIGAASIAEAIDTAFQVGNYGDGYRIVDDKGKIYRTGRIFK